MISIIFLLIVFIIFFVAQLLPGTSGLYIGCQSLADYSICLFVFLISFPMRPCKSCVCPYESESFSHG